MALPASFARDGFTTAEVARRRGHKLRGLLIGSDGPANSGKTEFILSAPGPGLILCLDRGFDAMMDNQTPPRTRRSDFAFHVVTAPLATQATQPVYVEHWKAFYANYMKALANPDARTVGLDGDSDSWELERLAAHGRLTGIFPATRYTDVYAERKGMVTRAWDSGKIVIATNKVGPEYKPIKDRAGNFVRDDKGELKKEPTGQIERQGFRDQDYLWQIQIRHLFEPARTNKVTGKPIPHRWGLRIMQCKANMELIGEELWSEQCSFQNLVSLVYPQYPLTDWGYKNDSGDI